MNQLTSIVVPGSRRFPFGFGSVIRFALFGVAIVVASSSTTRAQSQKGGVPTLEQRVAVLEELVLDFNAQKNDLQAQVAVLKAQVAALQTTLAPLRRVGNDVIFEGCNVHIRSGSGRTDGALNGLGNFIVGYNEGGGAQSRAGSHNLVVGSYHVYRSYASFIAGYANEVGGPFASVSGGKNNRSSGPYATVGGGYQNLASGEAAVASGGWGEEATRRYMFKCPAITATYD